MFVQDLSVILVLNHLLFSSQSYWMLLNEKVLEGVVKNHEAKVVFCNPTTHPFNMLDMGKCSCNCDIAEYVGSLELLDSILT